MAHWELKCRRKKGRITFAVVLTFFIFIIIFRFTGLSGRLIQTVPTLT